MVDDDFKLIREYTLTGEGAGNVEALALGKPKKPKKRDILGEKAKSYMDEDEAEAEDAVNDEDEMEDEEPSGDEKVAQALQAELQSAFLAGMIVGKEEPDAVPDFDEELFAVEHEILEAQEEEAGEDLDGDEGRGEEHGYADSGFGPGAGRKIPSALKGAARRAPNTGTQKDGKVLKPSKKNPKVRRWQRIKEAAKSKGVQLLDASNESFEKAAKHEVSALKSGIVKAGAELAEAKAKGNFGKDAAQITKGVAGTLEANSKKRAGGHRLLGAAQLVGGLTLLTVAGAMEGSERVYKALANRARRDPRFGHKYWAKKQSWAVEKMAKKSGVEPEVAARALSKVYAHHIAQGMSKGAAHKQAIRKALIGGEEGE